MKTLMLSLILLVSCGKIRTENKVELEGQSYSYVIVKFEFVEQIKQLCDESTPVEGIEPSERTRVVAQCTLDKINILNLDALNEFDSDVCPEPETVEEFNICEVLQGVKQ